MIAQNKKQKITGILFLLAAVGMVLNAVLTYIQVHTYEDQIRRLWIVQSICWAVAVATFLLLAVYSFKFCGTEKGGKFYVLILAAYAVTEVLYGYLTLLVSCVFSGVSPSMVMKVLEELFFWAVLAVMLFVMFHRSRRAAWVGNVVFGGYALLLLHRLAVNGQNISNYRAFVEPQLLTISYIAYAVAVCTALLQLAAFWTLWWQEGGNWIFKKNVEEPPAVLNKKQKIWRICFIACFLLTIFAYCLLTYHTLMPDPIDPEFKYVYPLGLAIWSLYTGIPFIAILIGEFAFYRSIKDSLRTIET